MWNLIEETLRHLDTVPDKTTMSDAQVLKLYDIITESNEMFRMLEQIAKLKKSIDDLTRNG